MKAEFFRNKKYSEPDEAGVRKLISQHWILPTESCLFVAPETMTKEEVVEKFNDRTQWRATEDGTTIFLGFTSGEVAVVDIPEEEVVIKARPKARIRIKVELE